MNDAPMVRKRRAWAERGVFISYSRTNSDFVDALAYVLAQAEYAPWVDRSGLEGGRRWFRQIMRAMNARPMCIVALSPAAIASKYVKKEYRHALWRNRKIVVVVIEDIPVIPALLRGRPRIDFRIEAHAFTRLGLAAKNEQLPSAERARYLTMALQSSAWQQLRAQLQVSPARIFLAHYGRAFISLALVAVLLVNLVLLAHSGVITRIFRQVIVPAKVIAPGSVVYAVSHDGKLQAIARATGQEIWQQPVPGSETGVAAADHLIFAGTTDQLLVARDAATGNIVWHYALAGTLFATPMVVNDIVYAASSGGDIVALQATTGQVHWTSNIPADEGQIDTPLLVQNDKAYFGTTRETVVLAESEGGLSGGATPFGGHSASAPTVADGMIYVGSDDHGIYAFAGLLQPPVWHFATGAAVVASPVVVGAIVYAGSLDGMLYALDRVTGQLRWQLKLGGPISTSVIVANGVVYVGSAAKVLAAVDATTGAVRWQQPLPGALSTMPTLAGTTLYVATDDGTITALDTHGNVSWTFTGARGAFAAAPLVIDRTLYVGSADGRLHAIDAVTGKQQWAADLGSPLRSGLPVIGP